MTIDRPEESPGPAETSRSGRRRGVLHAFFDRRQHAWERVYELEERAEAARAGVRDLKRANESRKRALEIG